MGVLKGFIHFSFFLGIWGVVRGVGGSGFWVSGFGEFRVLGFGWFNGLLVRLWSWQYKACTCPVTPKPSSKKYTSIELNSKRHSVTTLYNEKP